MNLHPFFTQHPGFEYILPGLAIVALLILALVIYQKYRQNAIDYLLGSVYYMSLENVVIPRGQELGITISGQELHITRRLWRCFSADVLGSFVGSLLYFEIQTGQPEEVIDRIFDSVVSNAYHQLGRRKRDTFFLAITIRYNNQQLQAALKIAIERYETSEKEANRLENEAAKIERGLRLSGVMQKPTRR